MFRHTNKNRIMNYLSFSICFLVFAMSCSSVKMDNPENAKTLVEVNKGACFGDCPVYHLALNTDGSLIYTGKKNVDKIGVYKTQLTKKQYKAIINSIDESALIELEDQYNEDVMDGQITTLEYHGSDKLKKIRTVYSYPLAMETLVNEMINTSEGDVDWIGIDVPNVNTDEKDVIIKSDKPTRRVISYDQGPCFGTCPSFSLEILTNRQVIFIGKRFVDKEGIYEKVLSEKKYDEIVALFNNEEFYALETLYDKDIMDAQSFTMKFYDENSVEKSVKTKITQTELVQQIIAEMQNLADSRGWEKKEAEEDVTPADETILISLNPKIKAKDWIVTKEHLGLEIERFLSPNGTYFIVSYNTELEINRVMEELRRDRNVLNVSRGDRPAKPRSGNIRTGSSNKHGKVNIKKNDGN